LSQRTPVLALIAIIAGVAAWTGCTNAITVKAAVKPEKDRKAAPDFALKDSNGQTVHLSDYKGKVVLLDFWATWCGPCKIEIPWFIEIEQQFKDRGFAVLGVSMDEDGWEVVKPYVQQMKINYRVVLGNSQVADLYGGLDSLPTTLVLDRQGRIASIHVGLTSGGKEEFRNDITHVLDASRAARAPSGRVLAFLAGPN
jgi:cytochrome c biogenesis protein CcmG/thiol:disulfide interchange protein DsbE